ncbi:MAG: LysM peptidoglycan-binding domain-containing protein [Clostridia bacterium]|nr:LysM peptidoglycan-binding domain-containing protein [Clostridia bacterium]
MIIYVVKSGDTLFGIANQYGVNINNLAADNGLDVNDTLVIGQAIAVQIPEITHTVTEGETLFQIARQYNTSVYQLFRNNYILNGIAEVKPGLELIIRYQNQGEKGSFITNSYAYPYIENGLLRQQLSYLSYFTPFTYGISVTGGLVDLQDGELLRIAAEYETKPLLHLSTLTEEGGFSNDRASMIFNDSQKQEQLIDEIINTVEEKGFLGVDVDFEFIYPEERYDYVAFLQNLRLRLNPLGYPLLSAVAPKTSDTQSGVLYEGHDYAGIGAAANAVLLMTYEWGYTFGPPLAVAPLPNVRRVVEYALTRISREKIFMGIPTYGYDWTLPYQVGNPGAPSLSPVEAIDLARRYSAEIQYDTNAQSPWFRYTDESGRLHEVWFEDARSIQAKLELAREFGLRGIGYWNLMREFPQNWVVLNNEYNIEMNPDLI